MPAVSGLAIAVGPELIAVGLPVLAGEATDQLFHSAVPVGRMGEFALFQLNDWLLGAATVPLAPTLEAVTHQLYLCLFSALDGRHLARIWNYVPAINASGADGLENYRAFCRGRSLAFEKIYGTGFKALLPAGSAVGSKSSELTVIFAACTARPRHVENPLQLPAADYPAAYGPRPPSFARATVAAAATGARVFISGTAAIRGHATVAPDDTATQLTCTLENLRTISLACDLGTALDGGARTERHFKVYVRHPGEQPLIAARLSTDLLRAGDHVAYLHADICRADLNVEIEVTVF